jgi:DNA polymerase-3 subunit epsilon
MAKVFPVVSASLEDVVVVHHSPFDKTAIARAALKYGTTTLPCIWLDTVRVARRAWPHFKADGGGHGLARLAQEFGIDFRHHDAAEDARAAGLILQRAIAEAGLNLAGWIDRVEKPILDSASENRTARGVPSGRLFGETIVFTGRLALSRSEATSVAIKAGGDVDGGVTQRTTILVVGDQDLRATKGQEKSAKHRKAEKLILDGSPVRIVGESDFLRMTGANI